MKQKQFLILAFLFVCTLAVAQTRRIEAKKKTQEEDSPAMTKPEIVFNVGHTDHVKHMHYTSDGKYLVSTSNDGTTKLWEIETGRLLRTLTERTGGVKSVVYSSNKKYVAIHYLDNDIQLWNVEIGKCIKILSEHTAKVDSIVFNPDGKHLTVNYFNVIKGSDDTESYDIIIKIWEVESANCVKTFTWNSIWYTSLIAYSPDGAYLATTCANGLIRIWEVKTGECIRTLSKENEEYVDLLTFSPNNEYLAIGYSGGLLHANGKIKVLEIETGKIIKTLSGHKDKMNAIKYSPDGAYLATDSRDDTIKLWEVTSGKCISTIQDIVTDMLGRASIIYSPDGVYLTTCHKDNSIKLWELTTGHCVKTLTAKRLDGYSDPYLTDSMAYSPDGLYLTCGLVDGTIRIWEIATETCVKILTEKKLTEDIYEYLSPIETIAYNPDGQYLASCSWDKTIKVWQVRTEACVKTLGGSASAVAHEAYSPDGAYMTIEVLDDTIKLWDMASGKFKILSGNKEDNGFAYSPDGAYVVTSANGTIKLWELASGKCVKTFIGHAGGVGSILYSSDGKYITSRSTDKTIKIWEVESGKCIKTLTGHKDTICSFVYSSDGKYITSSSDDNTIKIWEVESGKCIKTLTGHKKHIHSFVYSPDEKYIASDSYDDTIKIWDVKTGKCLKTLEKYDGCNIHSFDGKHLVSTGKEPLAKIWDVETGECIKIIDGNFNMHRVKCSPDGKYLAMDVWDGTIKLWEVKNGECIEKTLSGHTGYINNIIYGTDGKYLISCSHDSTIKFWELGSGKCVKTLTGHKDNVYSVVYSPSGAYLTSMSWDRTAKLWDVKTGKCMQTLNIGDYNGNGWDILYSPNEKYLATFSLGGNTIDLWNVKTGKHINTLHMNTLNIDVMYSPDEKYITTISDSSITKFWNASTGELLSTTFNLKDGEWLTYTPEGFFAGSEWATKNLVHIVDGMKTIGIDQMYDSLYRPDLVSAKLRGENISSYAQRVNFASLARSGSAPITAFLDFDEEPTNRDVAIEYSIQNTGGGIGEVNLLLNGKNICLSEGVKSNKGDTVYFSHTVTLQNGKNILELYAKNEAGKIESLRVTKTLNWHGNTKKPNLYVLTVAINKYRDRQLQLKYAVPDAQIITQGFLQQKKSLYQNIFTYNLFDGDVTKAGLKASFEKLASQVQADDVFVFYIAGHGVTYDEDGDYYYLPSDFRYTSSESIAKNGISKNDLTRYLSLIKAGKTLVLMDTCNSGSFLSTSSRGMSEKTAIDRLTRSTGHATIVASSDSQSAMEGYEGHGIFTYILLEGLNGKADADGDGFITLQELSAYAEEEVPRRSYEKWGYEQTPMRDLRKQDFPVYAKP